MVSMVKLVGILNITPDSFSDGGNFIDPVMAIKQAEKLFHDGASIVDVGAESTRPGAIPLTSEEEWARLKLVLEVLIPMYPGKISLDSYHPETILNAFTIGPVIINDVTGMNNPEMVNVATNLKATVIVNHIPFIDIQRAHELKPVSTVSEVKRDLLAKAKLLESNGIEKLRIILDPGIGFGKTRNLNLKLLRFAEQVPDYEVMIGYSKKRFLGDERMELGPNLKAGQIAASSGAAYLRVHDVAGHVSLSTTH